MIKRRYLLLLLIIGNIFVIDMFNKLFVLSDRVFSFSNKLFIWVLINIYIIIIRMLSIFNLIIVIRILIMLILMIMILIILIFIMINNRIHKQFLIIFLFQWLF